MMNQLGLFEDLLFRELGGEGLPTKMQAELVSSLICNNIIPILGGDWYVPKKSKRRGKLNTTSVRKALFSSEK